MEEVQKIKRTPDGAIIDGHSHLAALYDQASTKREIRLSELATYKDLPQTNEGKEYKMLLTMTNAEAAIHFDIIHDGLFETVISLDPVFS